MFTMGIMLLYSHGAVNELTQSNQPTQYLYICLVEEK